MNMIPFVEGMRYEPQSRNTTVSFQTQAVSQVQQPIQRHIRIPQMSSSAFAYKTPFPTKSTITDNIFINAIPKMKDTAALEPALSSRRFRAGSVTSARWECSQISVDNSQEGRGQKARPKKGQVLTALRRVRRSLSRIPERACRSPITALECTATEIKL